MIKMISFTGTGLRWIEIPKWTVVQFGTVLGRGKEVWEAADTIQIYIQFNTILAKEKDRHHMILSFPIFSLLYQLLWHTWPTYPHLNLNQIHFYQVPEVVM